jgi:hypothetical protein
MFRVRSPRARHAGTFAVALLLLAAPCAWGQTDEERAGARAAASEGLKAFEAKKWTEALDLFRRAESLVHAPPHLLYMARANTQLGHLVEAHELYERIKNENITPDKPRAFQQAHTDAETELAALEPSIPYVKVVVNGAGSKPVTMTVDGTPVNSALLGVSRPIDPGEHKFQATAEGLKSEVASLVVKKGEQQQVVLELHPAPGTPAPVAVAPAAPGSAGAATAPPPSAAPPSAGAPTAPAPVAAASASASPSPSPSGAPPAESNGARIGSYAAFGLGAVGLGVGIAFVVIGNHSASQANALCNGPMGECPLSQKSTITQHDSDAKTDRTIGIVGFAVGGAALATAVTLLFVGGHEGGSPHATVGDARSPVVVQPWVGFGSAGLNGSF